MKWLAAIALLLILAGCQSTSPPRDRAATTESAPVRGRAQMWTQNCIRCHNARSPGYYSDREWQLAMHHMRVRCSITSQEYKAILSFLQSAN
jgi:mono/diheme cytochrome c family protein